MYDYRILRTNFALLITYLMTIRIYYLYIQFSSILPNYTNKISQVLIISIELKQKNYTRGGLSV